MNSLSRSRCLRCLVFRTSTTLSSAIRHGRELVAPGCSDAEYHRERLEGTASDHHFELRIRSRKRGERLPVGLQAPLPSLLAGSNVQPCTIFSLAWRSKFTGLLRQCQKYHDLIKETRDLGKVRCVPNRFPRHRQKIRWEAPPIRILSIH